MEKKKSASLEREIKGYPPPKYHRLFIAFMKVNDMGKSETICHIVKGFFDNMPEGERQQIIFNSEHFSAK